MEIEEVGILFGVFLVEHSSWVVPRIRIVLSYCVNLFLRGPEFRENFFSSFVQQANEAALKTLVHTLIQKLPRWFPVEPAGFLFSDLSRN